MQELVAKKRDSISFEVLFHMLGFRFQTKITIFDKNQRFLLVDRQNSFC